MWLAGTGVLCLTLGWFFMSIGKRNADAVQHTGGAAGVCLGLTLVSAAASAMFLVSAFSLITCVLGLATWGTYQERRLNKTL